MNRSLRSERRSLFFCILAVFILCTPKVDLAYTEEDAHTSVHQAEEAIFSAFDGVLEAEACGANVSTLGRKMDEAVRFLAEAKNLLRNEEFGQVVELSDVTIGIANEARDEASRLRVSVLSQRDYLFKVSVVSSALGVAAFISLMLLFWRWFKGYYSRNILNLEPEVTSDAKP